AAGEAFADVVIGLAAEDQGDAGSEKRSKALAGTAVKLLGDLAARFAAAAAHEDSAESGADAAVGILDWAHFGEGGAIGLQRVLGGEFEARGALPRSDAARIRDRHEQERVEAGAGAKAFVPAGEVAEGARAKLREAVANFFRELAEVGDDHFGFSGKASAKGGILRRDSNGTGIEMALARHHAANGEERSGAEAKFV